MGNPRLTAGVAASRNNKRRRSQNDNLAANAGGGRATRRNPNPSTSPVADDSSDDGIHRRREKKLRHVLLVPNSAPTASDLESARKLKLDSVDNGAKHSVLKTTTTQEPSDCDPTTPLPDKKLLLIILDKLQKKDTYGVFSEPVDPDELPDYHDIIEHPMDFGTIRKKLADGVYTNLEQFEKDVFLICSNAMQYNAPETIYYRQAQRIQELAQKKIESFRQQGDENGVEPRPARRGRPPIKNDIRKTSEHPAEYVCSDFSPDATVATVGYNAQGPRLSYDLLQQEMSKPVLFEEPTKLCVLPNVEAQVMNPESKPDRSEYSGSGMKGLLSFRNGKKFSSADESRRNTYTQFQSHSSNSSVLTALNVERKQLQPVGLHIEHAYARSLARFAADLGPLGWEVASKLIERALPPGMKFGHGWVGNDEIPKRSEPSLFCRNSGQSSRHEASQSPMSEPVEQPSNNLIEEVAQVGTSLTPQPASSTALNRSSDSLDGSSTSFQDGFKLENGSFRSIQPNTPSQLDQSPATCPTLNGLNPQIVFNHLSQNGEALLNNYNKEATMMTHSRALDMVTRKSNSLVHKKHLGHMNVKRVNSVHDPSTSSGSDRNNNEAKQQCLTPYPTTGPVPPDLNVGFHSPGSPASSMVVDSPRPDLALQL